MKSSESQLTALKSFVRAQHVGQTIGRSDRPYYAHLSEVSWISSTNHIPFGAEAGLCHDLFEKTSCSAERLLSFLNKEAGYSINESKNIVRIVLELSDHYTPKRYPNLNRAERKRLENIRMKKISANAQSIKYADIISNTELIRKYNSNFFPIFREEILALLKVMDKGDADMHSFACKELENKVISN